MNSVTRTMQLHCGKTVDACHRRRRSVGDISECNSANAQRGSIHWPVAATSCGFKIALTGTNVGDRRMTTIRLINAGGSAMHRPRATIGPEVRVGRKKRRNHGLYVRGSTVYSACSENERKRRKK